MNGAKWDSTLNLEENVKNSLDLLKVFNRRVDADIDLDGFLIEIDEERYGDTGKNRPSLDFNLLSHFLILPALVLSW